MKDPENHPRRLGERYAQDIYNDSEQTDAILNEFGRRVVSYYTGRHRDKASPGHQRTLGIFRTTAAVLLHATEIELARSLEAAKQRGNLAAQSAAIPSAEADQGYFMELSESYQSPAGRGWDFFRISSLFNLEVTRRFMYRVLFEPDHWAGPIYRAYRENLPAYSELTRFPRLVYDPKNPDRQSCIHIFDNAVNSNFTVLDMFGTVTRHGHYRLWGQGADPAAASLSRINELAWPDSTSRKFFESRLQSDDPRSGCPFSHDAGDIAQGSIYREPSLREGPWDIRGRCPANISLTSPHHPKYANITPSELRLTSLLPVAAETLWKK